MPTINDAQAQVYEAVRASGQAFWSVGCREATFRSLAIDEGRECIDEM